MHADRPSREKEPVALIHEEISKVIIGAFFEVYNALGFGFLEVVYARALEIVLRRKGLRVERQYPLEIHFQGEQIGFYRCDMIVERTVIIEIKATELLAEASKKQLRNYLAASRLRLGMLLHFGPKAQFHRVLGPGADET